MSALLQNWQAEFNRRVFESAGQAIVPNSTVTLAHGLGARPRWFAAFVRCVTAEHGYAIDDEFQIASVYYLANVSNAHANGVGMAADGANVYAIFGAHDTTGIYSRVSRTFAYVTNARWNLFVRAIA